MTPAQMTMLSIHAHPDDEALFTGGVIARYSREGVRQVLITCTDGHLGFDSVGRGSHDEGHAPEAVGAERRSELLRATEILGVDRLETLGYRDSGMAGWDANDDHRSFVQAPLDEVGARIAAIITEEQPQVVVTYADDGFYGHPDHIATHHATMAGLALAQHPCKLYFVAMATGPRKGFAELAAAAARVLPEWIESELIVGTDDDLVQTVIDCGPVSEIKRAALAAHGSQVDNADLVAMEPELFRAIFGTESFVRAADNTGSPLPEDDLFAGVPSWGPPAAS
ncbi:MAG: PIG-L family deacetylase [Actinomycetes bacterium]